MSASGGTHYLKSWLGGMGTPYRLTKIRSIGIF